MFTVEQVKSAHSKVKSGADFPKYIREIRQMGVTGFKTRVIDSRTEYFGKDNYRTESQPMYGKLTIEDSSDREKFSHYLAVHQQGKTDYYTFCKHCAETGIENWIVSLDEMTCTYYDKHGNAVLTEAIPE